MSTEIKVPTLGESVTTATVARWIRKVGETVAQDEPIVELETDKVTVEVNAPQAGTIEAIAADEGAEVEVGALLGTIGTGTGAATAPKKADPAAEARPAANPQPGVNPPPPPSGPVARTGHAPMPAAQKMMTEQKIDAAQVDGTGKDGRITKGDVLAF
ncbi:MAG TPA: E3 binding domain-containing protein, partial [Acidiphilium sp.]|nr:E3 binding domain-containing protein [Acidiphilium sp.]